VAEEKFYCDKCAALFYGPHYRPASGRHCESAENNKAEMQFAAAPRRLKLESDPPFTPSSQICRIADLPKPLTGFALIITKDL